MELLKKIKKIISHPAFIGFLHGIFIAAFLYLGMEYFYSNSIYEEIVSRATTPEMAQEEKAVAIMGAVHKLLEPRTEFFGGRGNISFGPLKALNASRTVLAFGGACGDYVHVLGRALKTAGIKVNVIQMRVGDVFGGHIIAEAQIGGKWVVLDPLYNLYFTNPDKSLATFQEISENWQYFKNQVPKNYEQTYNYAGMRRTNWGKIPIILPAVKKILDWTVGPETRREISLRAYALNVWLVYMTLLFLAYLALVFYTLKEFRDGKNSR
jgi:hypothetical protein